MKPLPIKFRRLAAWVLPGLVLLALAGWLGLRLVPLPPALLSGTAADTEFLDRHGQPLRLVRPGDAPFGHPLRYADIPQPLIEATLAAEDRRFWRHHGVDLPASFRALWQWVTHGHVISGGSTITQQLVKLAEPRPRTLGTKLIEALQALRLEQVWDKQHILAEYLNRLNYGNFNRGADAAARFYFAKPLADLSPAECALLAAIPQAPSRLNPVTHFDRAHKRQQWILGRMQAAGWLTQEELARELNQPLAMAKPRRTFAAPHFIDLLLATGGAENLSARTIRTSLDLELNQFAETTLRTHLATLRAQHVSNGAVIILDNPTGEVLALVGSEDYFSPAAGRSTAPGPHVRQGPRSSLSPICWPWSTARPRRPWWPMCPPSLPPRRDYSRRSITTGTATAPCATGRPWPIR